MNALPTAFSGSAPGTEGALGPFVKAIWLHKLLVLGITLTTVATALLWLQVRTPQYEARAQLLVTPLPQDDETFLGLPVLRDSGDPTRTVQTAATLLESPRAAQATAQQLGGDWTQDKVLTAVEVESEGESSVLNFTATAESSDEAARLANGLVRAVLQERGQALGSRISAELERLRTRLDQLEDPTGVISADIAAKIDQLHAVQSTGDPTLSLTQLATPPASQTGAGPMLVLPLALIAGLALGSGTALLLELFSRRVRDEEEVASIYPLPVLVRLPTLSARLLQRHPSGWQMPPVVHEAFRTIMAQLGSSDARPRTLMVTSASTGDGKTTSAINLAMSITAAGHSVILIDSDLRKPDVARVLGMDAGQPITEFLRPDLDQRLGKLLKPVPGAPGLRLLCWQSGVADVLLVDAFSLTAPALLKAAAAQADFVVIDTPPLGEVADALRFVEAVDATIVVARPGNTHRRNLEFTRDLLERSGHRPIGYLLIGVAQGATGGYYSLGVGASRRSDRVSRGSKIAPGA